MSEPKSQAPKARKVFARPPEDWDKMTEAEQTAWAEELIRRIQAAAQLPTAD